MNSEALIAVGLTPIQAKAYALLIESGGMAPATAAKKLGITRTNAYKVLDKLVELRLISKHDEKNKLVYAPANPMALTNLSSKLRAEAVAREEAVNGLIHDLLDKYQSHSDKPSVEVATGRKGVAELYRKQVNFQEDISFIHTYADVTMMGFETMHEIRTKPARQGNTRRAIMGQPTSKRVNAEPHKRSNLDITWVKKEQYDAPVEWSVTSSSLLIVLYATEPHAILIVDKVVASAFLQLYNLLQSLLPKISHA